MSGEAESWTVPLGMKGPAGESGVRDPEGWLVARPAAPILARPVAPQHLQLVRQEMAVCPEQLSEFLDSLRQYLRGTAGARNCFQ